MKNMRTAVVLFIGFIFVLPAVAGLAREKTNRSDGITLAGTTQGNTGCIILTKHMPVKGKLLFAGVVYARTQYKVFRTFNAKLPKTEYTGSGEVTKLNQFAAQNKIKLVVIPPKYTTEQLKQAEADCHQ